MKKRWIILLAVLGVLVVVGIAGFVIADRKFAVMRSPAFSHEPLVTPETRVQIAVWPGRGEDTVRALLEELPEKQRPSSWVVQRILPQEVAILMAPDLLENAVHVTAFVNEQRFGPVICEAVNDANLSKSLPAVQWATEGMVLEKRGILTLRGEVPIAPRTLELAQAQWTGPAPAEPLELEGGHAIEALLDNRDGAAFVVLSALEMLKVSNGSSNPEFYVRMLGNIASIHMTGDFASANELAVTLRIQCPKDAAEDVPGQLMLLLDMGISQARNELSKRGGGLDGGSRIEDSPNGKVLVGEYTITGLDEVVAAQFAPASETADTGVGAARLN